MNKYYQTSFLNKIKSISPIFVNNYFYSYLLIIFVADYLLDLPKLSSKSILKKSHPKSKKKKKFRKKILESNLLNPLKEKFKLRKLK